MTVRTEADYRVALVDHVAPRDYLEAHEMRKGKGHNEWGPEENVEAVRRTEAHYQR